MRKTGEARQLDIFQGSSHLEELDNTGLPGIFYIVGSPLIRLLKEYPSLLSLGD